MCHVYIMMLSANAGYRIRGATLGWIMRRVLLERCSGDCERLVQRIVLGAIQVGQLDTLSKGLEVGTSL